VPVIVRRERGALQFASVPMFTVPLPLVFASPRVSSNRQLQRELLTASVAKLQRRRTRSSVFANATHVVDKTVDTRCSDR